MLPRQRIASQIMAIVTQKSMSVVMLSLIESMQYCEKTTTKTIGRKGSTAKILGAAVEGRFTSSPSKTSFSPTCSLGTQPSLRSR